MELPVAKDHGKTKESKPLVGILKKKPSPDIGSDGSDVQRGSTSTGSPDVDVGSISTEAQCSNQQKSVSLDLSTSQSDKVYMYIMDHLHVHVNKMHNSAHFKYFMYIRVQCAWTC